MHKILYRPRTSTQERRNTPDPIDDTRMALASFCARYSSLRSAAQAMGLPESYIATLSRIRRGESVSAEQENAVRAALRVPPYWMAYSPSPPAPSVAPRGQD